jgi:predicted MFS family arabinose efflux permease
VNDAPADLSYRALLRVPDLGRVLLSMQMARVAQAMVSIALVLFTLDRYGSPALAGLVTFASVFPGLIISPIAGALLDRHGRIRLVILDFVVALSAMVLIAVLAIADALPAPLLIAIAVVSSLTSILSHTGLRSLFPIMVPRPLWERVNAVDSNGYLVAMILGPPLAAALVAFFGAPVALIAIGVAFAISAFALIGVADPATPSESEHHLLSDAWGGVVYVWRNPTLRGLGFAISFMNVAGGMVTIVLPLIVLERLQQGEAVVGLIFALTGVSGMASAFAFGRVDSRGREWSMLVWPMLAAVPVMAMLLPAAMADVALVGIVFLGAHSLAMGVLYGPSDIALFTVRQRRTDPAWIGRAFAVSMAVNYMGVPIGAGLAGLIASGSIELAILILGVGGSLAAAASAAFLVPRHAPEEGLPVRAPDRAEGASAADL